jgi:hypothetical protein
MADLSGIRELVLQELAADSRRKALQQELEEVVSVRDELRKAIAQFMGEDETGYVDGKPVVSYARKGGAAFASAQFRKRYPELHEMFLVKRVKEELDLPALRNQHPDVFREFQVRAWSNAL